MLTNEERATYVAVKSAAQAINHNLSTIDWEQRRYEIAKKVIGMLAFGMMDLPYEDKKFTVQDGCKKAIEIADELIKQLKETKQ